METIKKLFNKYRQFILFCCVGAGNTIITLATVYLLDSVLGINYLLASSIGYLVGVVHGYLWSTFLVFKAKRTATNATKFLITNLIVLAVNNGIMYLLVSVFGFSDLLGLGVLPAQGMTICVTMVLNFVINKFWTFREA